MSVGDDATRCSEIETLRDGRAPMSAPFGPDDRSGLEEAAGRGSAESPYRRFGAVRRNFSDASQR
jgi:hypothetical protein